MIIFILKFFIMNLIVKKLIEKREYFEEVLNLIYDEWGHKNYEFWRSWIQSSMSKERIPITFVVLKENELIGTFSFWHCDLQSRQDLYPWLGGIVVKKEYRGQGIGLFIQNQANKYLKELGFNEAYLFTELNGFYEKTGWTFFCNGYDEFNNYIRIYKIYL